MMSQLACPCFDPLSFLIFIAASLYQRLFSIPIGNPDSGRAMAVLIVQFERPVTKVHKVTTRRRCHRWDGIPPPNFASVPIPPPRACEILAKSSLV